LGGGNAVTFEHEQHKTANAPEQESSLQVTKNTACKHLMKLESMVTMSGGERLKGYNVWR
jgi:hypothetical protein